MVMLVDHRKLFALFYGTDGKLSALGAEMDIAIRMQREDIFNAMHRI